VDAALFCPLGRFWGILALLLRVASLNHTAVNLPRRPPKETKAVTFPRVLFRGKLQTRN